jgi:exodeoxyribonuclease-1
MAKKVEPSFFWHDYETFGTNPQLDGVSQFAGVRTNLDLEEIDEPVDLYCKMTPDRLPNPMACMVTGVKPSEVQKKGLNETTFFHRIDNELGKAGTCGIGYNNISFDDEVTRNGNYRNFIDIYRREWANQCSRWDLLNVVRMASALYPGIINVPLNPETGKKVFKLDQLSPANGIIHENAHEALSDVRATIALAKMIKDAQPEFWEAQFKQRNKQGVGDFLFKGYDPKAYSNTLNFKPFLMADSFFGGEQDFIEVLYPIYANKMNVYCIKLTKSLDSLLTQDAETLKANMFKSRKPELPEEAILPSDKRAILNKIKKQEANNIVYIGEGEERIPLHTIKINKCPVLAPSNLLNKETAAALGIDGNVLRENIQKIKDNFIVLQQKIEAVFSQNDYPEKDPDVDTQIYSGGFFSKTDQNHFAVLKKTNSVEMLDYLRNNIKAKKFDDKKRVPEMIFRFIARNYEQDLDMKAYEKWMEMCKERITNPDSHYSMTFEEFQEDIDFLKKENAEDDFKLSVLADLEDYAQKLKEKLSI